MNTSLLPNVSVVIPVYNEVATFDTLMQRVLAKQIEGKTIEVIVVESNSTDGTREKAMAYHQHPRVKLILEERPQGKGHAVRTGFAHAIGDIILIQDADLEYDVNDYDALLEPIFRGETSFVLGSRHGGTTHKIRVFNGQPLLTLVCNSAHIFFTTVINVLFGLHLRDPHTMFKVFRRECLSTITLTANRFDIDFEILLKLVKRGYIPIEIPVSYQSRSFKEGKKISLVGDPFEWLWMIIKVRFFE